MPAKIVFESAELIDIIEQPVDAIRAFENFRPALAAVGRLVNAAVVAIAPESSRHACIHGIAIAADRSGSSRCARNFSGPVRPVVAAVGGLVDSVADRDAVPRPRLSGAHPDRSSASTDRSRSRRSIAKSCLSNTGLNVVPPFIDFHTPPLAAPMYTVSRPLSFTAATDVNAAAHLSRPNVPRPKPGNRVGIDFHVLRLQRRGSQECRHRRHCRRACKCRRQKSSIAGAHRAPPVGFAPAFASVFTAGIAKRESSTVKFASTFTTVIFIRFGSPFCPASTANG